MTESTEQTTPTNGGGLASLKLAQLQALASQLGIAGGSRMRKADLVTAISDHQRGGSVADLDAAERAAQASAAPAAETAAAAASSEDAAPAAARQARRRSRRADADTSAPAAAQDGQPQAEAREAQTEQAPRETASDQDRSGGSETRDEGEDRPQSERRSRGRRRAGDDDAQQGQDRRSDGAQGEDGADADRRGDREDRDDNGRENGRGRNGRNGRDRDNGRDRENGRENNRDRENGRDGSREQRGDKSEDGGRGDGGRGDRSRRDDRDDEGGRNRRNRRNRNERGRNRRGRGGPEVDETELTEDDVLQPVAGILDVLDNYAFVRTSGYLPGPNDVYVSLAMVKKYGLRKGDAVVGAIRAPRDGEKQQHHGGGSNRQKFNALVKISSVNGQPAVEHPQRVEFGKLVPLYPQERLRLETDPKLIGPRVIDLVSPIGKGQRGLIVSPPKAGKTMILQSIANAIKTNNPEVHLMMVLVDERPEEVTDMQRSVDGEVIASTFDRPADDHTTLAELAIERAKRLVEMGRDVVVLLDSMTRLGRAYNLAAPASGRILSGGVDSSALYPPKKFFGAARNIENGGSLTILATALVETGSRMDEVIFEEFKGTGNMELRLSRHLAERRIFPAVDVNASGTRREEALLSQEEVKIMWKLRRVLSGLEQQQALDLLTNKIKDTASNAEFLMLVSKTTLGSKGDD
ncbi:transcription termination factor Rho [Micrococcus yunnanensis]|uniref:transcription termination factor Rho n=1 Tax=Micrococcus yunnanensis TaxID=566027 RepID=UPI0031D7AB84